MPIRLYTNPYQPVNVIFRALRLQEYFEQKKKKKIAGIQTIIQRQRTFDYHLDARPAFNRDTYKSWFHVSGTPGKHQ